MIDRCALRRVVAALTVLPAMLSCNRPEAPPAKPASPPLEKVSVMVQPTPSYAPIRIARDEGFFRDEGLDAELVHMQTAEGLIAATAGKLDVVAGPIRIGFFNVVLRGEPIAIVADKGHSEPGPCSPDYFVARKEYEARLRNPSGWEGVKIATSKGTSTEYLLERLYAKRGVDPARVARSESTPSDFLTSFRNGSNDLRYAGEPTLTIARESGLITELAPIEELDPGHQFAVIVYGKRLLRERRDLGQRFMRAYLRGVARYNEGKTDRNVATLAAFTKQPAELIRRTCWYPIHSDGHLNMAAMDRFLAWGRRKNYLDGDLNVQQWWDPSFIEWAAAQPWRGPVVAGGR